MWQVNAFLKRETVATGESFKDQ